MIFVVYYCVTILMSVLSAFVFKNSIDISSSLLPVALIVLSIVQAMYFHSHRRKKDFNINNDSVLTEEEWAVVSIYTRNSFILSIPLYIPFVLFFSLWIKLFTIIIYLLAFSGGAVFWRIRYKRQLMLRLKAEDKELADQIKKEEMGKFN